MQIKVAKKVQFQQKYLKKKQWAVCRAANLNDKFITVILSFLWMLTLHTSVPKPWVLTSICPDPRRPTPVGKNKVGKSMNTKPLFQKNTLILVMCQRWFVLPPRKKKQRGPDEHLHVSKRYSPLSTEIWNKQNTQNKSEETLPKPTASSHTDPTTTTHRPAWKGPALPLFLKLWQHFAVELVLVEQRFDTVCVVLQVLQQHLQIPARQSTHNSSKPSFLFATFTYEWSTF